MHTDSTNAPKSIGQAMELSRHRDFAENIVRNRKGRGAGRSGRGSGSGGGGDDSIDGPPPPSAPPSIPSGAPPNTPNSNSTPKAPKNKSKVAVQPAVPAATVNETKESSSSHSALNDIEYHRESVDEAKERLRRRDTRDAINEYHAAMDEAESSQPAGSEKEVGIHKALNESKRDTDLSPATVLSIVENLIIELGMALTEHGDFKLSETLTKQMSAFLRANGVDTSTKASKVSKYKAHWNPLPTDSPSKLWGPPRLLSKRPPRRQNPNRRRFKKRLPLPR
jgi:hypothetical protein